MIPWAALLRHAPTIVAAADTLLTRARSRSDDVPPSLDERMARLEQSSRESAQLLHEIAQQVNALTLAQQKTARRAAVALALSVVAGVLAASALILTICRSRGDTRGYNRFFLQEADMDKVVHFEVPFDDKQRAMTFYAAAFGWQLRDMPEMDYVMAVTTEVNEQQRPKESGAINGGLFKRPQEAPHPAIYLGVASIDATIAKVEKAGGKVVTPKTPIPGMGAYARVRDTEGNVVGLFQA